MTSPTEQLSSIMSRLPSDLQLQVLDYAQYLLVSKVGDSEGAKPARFFICPVCFTAADQRLVCHDHLMIPCCADNPDDCKPLMDDDGQLKSRAPRWFINTITRLAG